MNEDLHITTGELLKIRNYLDKEGEDIELKLEHGLVFMRQNNKCSIRLPGKFYLEVDRLSVSKKEVMFENSKDDMNHIYISRSKRCPF